MTTIDRADEKTLILTRVFNAPRARVFEAWTNPERAAMWWGPLGFSTEACEMDVRAGGTYRIRMRSPQGTIHTKRGIYQEVAPPERLIFTWAWEDADGIAGHETLVTLRLEDLGTATKLTLHQAAFESAPSCADHRGGWTSCLDRFAAYLAST